MKKVAELIKKSEKTADAIIVGGGPVGLHTAHALYEMTGKNSRIIAMTQESEWGGIASRSLEQYRLFNDSYAMAELVSKGMDLYERLDNELREDRATERAYEQFPYIFTVGTKQRPAYIEELLPINTAERPDLTYYQKLKCDTESWGFNPQAEIVNPAELKERFPILDGQGIEGAMIVNSAGRLHFDVMKGWMMEKSRADGNNRGVSYMARTAVRRIILGKHGEAVGVDIGSERIYCDKVILALGAFALKLPEILPCEESQRLADNFTVTQRELFFANMPGVQADTNFFLISPDMAIARLSTCEGHASYGYAADDDPIIDSPKTDPRPNDDLVEKMQMKRRQLFVGRTYTLFSECSSRWNADSHDDSKPNLAIEPFSYSAGYYTAYPDGLPVVGPVADTGVILAAGSHHSGIMGGRGIAELVVDHTLGTNNISTKTHQQTSIYRTPTSHTGLML